MGEKGEKTRVFIRQKACGLFVTKGFQAVTMKDICEATELSRGGLYRHYGSTKEILEEILCESSKADSEFIIDGMMQMKSAAAILEDVLNKMESEMMTPEQSLSYAIYEYSFSCNPTFIAELNQKEKENWQALIKYGIALGEFRDVKAEQMAETILYTYQGVRMWSKVTPVDKRTIQNIIAKVKQDLKRQDT